MEFKLSPCGTTKKNYLLNTNSKSYPCFTIHKISINQHQSASNSVKQHWSTSICRERQKETEINIMGKYCKQQHLKYLQESCPSCSIIKRQKEKNFWEADHPGMKFWGKGEAIYSNDAVNFLSWNLNEPHLNVHHNRMNFELFQTKHVQK